MIRDIHYPIWEFLLIIDNCTRRCLGLPVFIKERKIIADDVTRSLEGRLPPELRNIISDNGKQYNPLHQPFTKNHHITLQSIKSEAITMLKVVILAICFEGDITFVISELKAKVSLRDFTGF